MSDELDRAVDARIDAFRPGHTPPFAVLRDRKRRRDRRRGTAALAATALAVAGVAFVPSALSSGVGTAPEQTATGMDAAYASFVIRYADQMAFDRSRDAVQDCLEHPSVVRSGSNFSDPPLLSGLLLGGSAPDRLFQCVSENAPGATVETAPADQQETPLLSPYTVSADGRTLTVTAEVGGGCDETGTASATARETAQRVEVTALVARPPAAGRTAGSNTVCATNLVTQQVRVSLDEPLGDREVIDASTGQEITADPKGGPPKADSTRYGVGVGWSDNRASYSDDAEAAVQQCFRETGLEELNTLTSRPPNHSGKITGKAAADALKTCVAEGAPGATVFLAPLPTPAQQAFIKECLGGNLPLAGPAPEYVGLVADVATRTKQEESASEINMVRVVGRDRECLGREDDRRDDRVNVIIEDDKVIWAGRF